MSEPRLVLAVENMLLPFGSHARISFQLRQAELLFVTGKNGIGKSTLLNCIAGLQKPKAGSLTKWTSRIGYFTQSPRIFWNLTVFENVLMGLTAPDSDIVGLMNLRAPYDARWASRVEDLLNEYDLTEKKDTCAALLSGGELQRLKFAQITASVPELLLLDEPFTDLDESSARIIAKAVNQLKQNAAIILVTHKSVPDLESQQIYELAA
jgi:ABC-type multidrug transport system ATPase subunit